MLIVQENFMKPHANRLPARFAVGTKLVIESHRARDGRRVYARHLEFPNGTFFPLPSRPPRKLVSKARNPRSGRS
jgi:hypothetical protein